MRLPPSQRNASIALIAALAVLGVIGARWFTSRNPYPVVEPEHPERLDAQLREYIATNLAWLRQAPGDLDRRVTVAMIYAANGLWPEAKAGFDIVASMAPEEPLARLHSAVALQQMGKVPEAIAELQRLAQAYPDQLPIQCQFADLAMRTGKIDEARKAYRNLVDRSPGEWRGHAGLAGVAIQEQQWKQAEEHVRKAIELAPSERTLRHLYGQALAGLGRTNEALIQFDAGAGATYTAPSDKWSATAYRHMKLVPDLIEQARTLEAAGQPLEAALLLDDTLKHHPDDVNLAIHLGEVLSRGGQHEAAAEIAHEVQAREPGNPAAKIILAQTEIGLGRYETALRIATDAVAGDRKVPAAFAAQANALLELGRDSEAVQALRAATNAFPKNPDLRIGLGDIHWRNLGNTAEARRCYEAARAISPSLVPALVRLADLALKEGRLEDASELIRTLEMLPVHPGELKALQAGLRDLRTGENGGGR